MLPFLLDESIVARVDLEADRQTSRLLVHATHLEERAPVQTTQALRSELKLLARWLDLKDIVGLLS